MTPDPGGSGNQQRLPLAVYALGFTALVTQTIVLREFLAVFNGNELIIGLVLASWMILTASGAFLSRFAPEFLLAPQALVPGLMLLSVLPLLTIFSLHFLRNQIFHPGVMIGLFESFALAGGLLIPFCLLSGYLFTEYSRRIAAGGGTAGAARVYQLEALGSVAGGLLYGLVAVFFLSTYQALIILACLNLVICHIVARGIEPKIWRFVPVLGLLLLVLGLSRIDLDRLTRSYLFPGQTIVAFQDSPYGNLTVTQQSEQMNFFENGVLLFSTNDVVPTEEAVHYAMIQHLHPKLVLLIGGGISGTTSEILKYGVERVDYVEINPSLLGLGKVYTSSLLDPRIRAIPGDGRLFVKTTTASYDVALVNIPDPITAQLNRYYTSEFLKDLKRKLTDSAVVQFSLLPASEYLGPEARNVSSILYATLKSEFQQVLLVPGTRNYYLAGNRPLSMEIAQKVGERGIPTSYVNRAYIDDRINEARSQTIMRGLDPAAPLNRDFAPVAYLREVLYWVSYFGLNPWVPIAVIFVLLGIVAMRFNAITLGMFAGGFAASALELVLIFSFQIIYGYIYQVIGLLIAVFMAGLAIGVWLVGRGFMKSGMKSYIAVQVAIAAYACLLPVILVLLRDNSRFAVAIHILFALLTILVATLVGAQFALATGLEKGNIVRVASALYGVDLLGSALGALVVAVFLMPLLGLPQVCFAVAGLCLISAVFGYSRRAHYV
jgi:spermidine synthase